MPKFVNSDDGDGVSGVRSDKVDLAKKRIRVGLYNGSAGHLEHVIGIISNLPEFWDDIEAGEATLNHGDTRRRAA